MSRDDTERYYDRLDGGDITATAPFAIRCPRCDIATEIDPPKWECENCGETLELFVGTPAPDKPRWAR